VLFQTLDDKDQCVGIYYDGKLIFNFDDFPQDLTRTWRYSPYLLGYRGVDYAELYAQGKTLDQMCPDYLAEDWEEVCSKLKAFLLSFRFAKVNLRHNCFFDLVPEKFLRDYCQIKNQITNHVIDNYPKPSNYKHLAAVNAMISDIESQPLNIDMSPILPKVSDIKVANFVKRIKTCDRSIRYNLFGTVTGRLATRKNSFPILTMNKEYREVLRPNNDCFIELDYNGAELRVLLSLLGYDQPEHDVHQWNLDNVFENKVTRAEAKTLFFAWLYGSQSDDVKRHSSLLKEKYNKDTLIDKYWDGHVIRTPFDRDVVSPKHKALNYLVQSVAADLALEQATRVWALLKKNKAKSSVAFIVHDALVIDFDLADRELFKEVQEVFSLTRFGKFPVNKSIGKDFGSLIEVA
tara:strand:- start:1747 stop:2961 length:1215 start_codon:yes stop_codon:yes gene_type:complete